MYIFETMQYIRFNKRTICFYVSYVLLIVYRVLKSTTMGFNDHGFTYILIVAFLICEIRMLHVKVNTFYTICVLCPIIILCILHSWDPIVPIVALMLFAAKEIDFQEIVKTSYKIVFTLVLVTVILTVMGVLEDTTSTRNLFGKSIVCHGAGFNHSSALPTYFCFLFLEYFYLKKGKVNFSIIILWLITGGVIFAFCGERLRFYLLIIACSLGVSSSMIGSKYQKLKRISSLLIFPVLCILTNCLGYFYEPSNSFLYSLNIALSNRLYFERFTFDSFGIPIWGQNLKMGEKAMLINGVLDYFYIDSGYVYIFTVYGIIIGALIIAVYMIGSYKSTGLSNNALFIWFICMAIDAIVGNQMMSIWICPLLFVPFCKSISMRD